MCAAFVMQSSIYSEYFESETFKNSLLSAACIHLSFKRYLAGYIEVVISTLMLYEISYHLQN